MITSSRPSYSSQKLYLVEETDDGIPTLSVNNECYSIKAQPSDIGEHLMSFEQRPHSSSVNSDSTIEALRDIQVHVGPVSEPVAVYPAVYNATLTQANINTMAAVKDNYDTTPEATVSSTDASTAMDIVSGYQPSFMGSTHWNVNVVDELQYCHMRISPTLCNYRNWQLGTDKLSNYTGYNVNYPVDSFNTFADTGLTTAYATAYAAGEQLKYMKSAPSSNSGWGSSTSTMVLGSYATPTLTNIVRTLDTTNKVLKYEYDAVVTDEQALKIFTCMPRNICEYSACAISAETTRLSSISVCSPIIYEYIPLDYGAVNCVTQFGSSAGATTKVTTKTLATYMPCTYKTSATGNATASYGTSIYSVRDALLVSSSTSYTDNVGTFSKTVYVKNTDSELDADNPYEYYSSKTASAYVSLAVTCPGYAAEDATSYTWHVVQTIDYSDFVFVDLDGTEIYLFEDPLRYALCCEIASLEFYKMSSSTSSNYKSDRLAYTGTILDLIPSSIAACTTTSYSYVYSTYAELAALTSTYGYSTNLNTSSYYTVTNKLFSFVPPSTPSTTLTINNNQQYGYAMTTVGTASTQMPKRGSAL